MNLRMEFKFNGLKHVLRGITPNDSKAISSSSLNKLMLHEPQLAFLHLQEVDNTESSQGLSPETIIYHIEASGAEPDTSGSLQLLLDSYSDIFDEPTELPLSVRDSTIKYLWNLELIRSTYGLIATRHYKKMQLTK